MSVSSLVEFMSKIKFTNDKLKNEERLVLLHCQVFGLREAGYKPVNCSREESEQLYTSESTGLPFPLGVYNFLWNNRKYSIRIAPYKQKENGLKGMVNGRCIWYLWCEKDNEEKMNDATELHNYLRGYGVGQVYIWA